MTLYAAAVAATLADATAFVMLIVPGTVAERNPVVLSMPFWVALLAKGLLLLGLGGLVIASERYPKSRPAVNAALIVAVVVGLVGTASTVGAVR